MCTGLLALLSVIAVDPYDLLQNETYLAMTPRTRIRQVLEAHGLPFRESDFSGEAMRGEIDHAKARATALAGTNLDDVPDQETVLGELVVVLRPMVQRIAALSPDRPSEASLAPLIVALLNAVTYRTRSLKPRYRAVCESPDVIATLTTRLKDHWLPSPFAAGSVAAGSVLSGITGHVLPGAASVVGSIPGNASVVAPLEAAAPVPAPPSARSATGSAPAPARRLRGSAVNDTVENDGNQTGDGGDRAERPVRVRTLGELITSPISMVVAWAFAGFTVVLHWWGPAMLSSSVAVALLWANLQRLTHLGVMAVATVLSASTAMAVDAAYWAVATVCGMAAFTTLCYIVYKIGPEKVFGCFLTTQPQPHGAQDVDGGPEPEEELRVDLDAVQRAVGEQLSLIHI